MNEVLVGLIVAASTIGGVWLTQPAPTGWVGKDVHWIISRRRPDGRA